MRNDTPDQTADIGTYLTDLLDRVLSDLQAVAEDAADLERFTLDEIDAETLAYLAADARDVKRAAGFAYDALVAACIERAGERKFEVAGLGLVEVKTGVRRTKWDMDELLRHATARIVETPGVLTDEEGEIHPPSVIAHNVAEQLRATISMSSGKVTGMRALGLQPDEFCTEDEAHRSIVLPRRDER